LLLLQPSSLKLFLALTHTFVLNAFLALFLISLSLLKQALVL
jgi:hypothetical protein